MKEKFEKHDNGRLVWSLLGDKGGFHIWAQMIGDDITIRDMYSYPFYGGIEVHYKQKPYDHCPDDAPIKNCWLTGCDCWPDGSSLQFEEQISPVLAGYINDPEKLNGFMFDEMRYRYKSTFGIDD